MTGKLKAEERWGERNKEGGELRKNGGSRGGRYREEKRRERERRRRAEAQIIRSDMILHFIHE